MPNITTNGTAFAAILSILLAFAAALGFDLKVEPETVILAGIGIATLIQSVGLLQARNNLDSDQKVGARPEAQPVTPTVVFTAPPGQAAAPHVIMDRRAPVQPAPVIMAAPHTAPTPVTIMNQETPVPVIETAAP